MTARFWVVLSLGLVLGCGGGGSDPDAGSPDAGVDAALTDAGTDAGADDAGSADAGSDAGDEDAGDEDAGVSDAGTDAGPSCLDEGHAVGDRVPVGDHCNVCECQSDGSSVCTTRTCAPGPTCEYAGTTHAYGERFAATDGVNECVCAASGLACTRRVPGTEEGAILLESLDEFCGDNESFTPNAVLAGIPTDDFVADFPYERDRALYPETRPDTRLRVRIVYEEGFAVCRVPSPTQPALDVEAMVEWISEDGAFDEAFHTYLRRNDFGFVDAWLTVGSAPAGGLHGTYDPSCLDPRGFSFAAQVNADGTAEGSISKVCESDILLDVGRFAYAP